MFNYEILKFCHYRKLDQEKETILKNVQKNIPRTWKFLINLTALVINLISIIIIHPIIAFHCFFTGFFFRFFSFNKHFLGITGQISRIQIKYENRTELNVSLRKSWYQIKQTRKQRCGRK